MGLPDSTGAESCACMNYTVAPGEIEWYGSGNTDALLASYNHDDGQAPVGVNDAYSTL